MQFIFGLIIGSALVFGWSYTQCIPKSELAEQQTANKECTIPLPLDCFELHNPRPIEGYFLEIHINRDNDVIAWARSNEVEGPVPRQGVPMKGEI